MTPAKLRRLARKINNAREWVCELARNGDESEDLGHALSEIDDALEMVDEALEKS